MTENATATAAAKTEDRRLRKTEVGVVKSDKRDKTRRVEIERLVPHPKYGKFMRRRTVCQVHDEQNLSRTGDTVEIMETRPISKTKRWRLVRIVREGSQRMLEAAERGIQGG